VGAVLGLGGIPTIRALRSKVNRVQPYRGQAPLPHKLRHSSLKIRAQHEVNHQVIRQGFIRFFAQAAGID